MNVSKSLAKKRWNINLSVTDLLNTYANRKWMQTADVLTWGNGSNTVRKVELTVSYNFNSTRSKFRGTVRAAQSSIDCRPCHLISI